MFLYIALILIMIPITMYYLNINPFTKTNDTNTDISSYTDISSLESSINELKNLNQYIDNGIPTSQTI